MDPAVDSPVKCVKSEIHNLLTVLKLTQPQLVSAARFERELRTGTTHPLLETFQALFEGLSYVDEFHLDTGHLQPFLKVVASPETGGALTAVALAAVNKFVLYELISVSAPGAAECINSLAEGVLAARFVTSQSPAHDEIVLLKILAVLIDTLRCRAGVLLTDATVWRMVKKAYQISRQPNASFLLRSSSENVLQQMVLLIFGRRPSLSSPATSNGTWSVTESPPSQKALAKEFSNTILPAFKDNSNTVSPTASIETSPQAEVSGPLNGIASAEQRGYGVPCMHNVLRFLAYLASYGSCNVPQGKVISEVPRNKSTALATKSGADNKPSRARVEDELALPFVRPSTLDSAEFQEEMRTLGLSLLNVALERGGEEIARNALLVKVVQEEVCKALLVNAARSTSLFLLSDTLRCVFNLFVYLKRHLKVQFEVFFNSIHLRLAAGPASLEQRELALESLLEFCREPDLIVELYENYDCDVRCTNLFENLVNLFCEGCSLRNEMTPPLSPGLGPLNINEDATGIGDQVSTLPFTALHRLALSGLLAVIHSLASKCRFNFMIAGRTKARDCAAPRSALSSEAASQIPQRDKQPNSNQEKLLRDAELSLQKQQKRRYELAASIFNSAPSRCLAALQNIGLMDVSTPTGMATFLRTVPGLDLGLLGEYLAKRDPWNDLVRQAFLRSFDFRGVPIVEALRVFLSTFKLPGEAQLIERIMEDFGNFYYESQPAPFDAVPHLPPAVARKAAESEEAQRRHLEALYTPRWVPLGYESTVPDEGETEQAQDGVEPGLYVKETPNKGDTVTDAFCNAESMHYSQNAESSKAAAMMCDKVGRMSALQELLSHSAGVRPTNDPPAYLEAWRGTSVTGPAPVGAVLLRDADTIFVLSFSIIMLNTDLHKPQVKSKMSITGFVKNNSGIDGGHDLPEEYLRAIYNTILFRPMALDKDDFTLDKNNPDGEIAAAEEEYWEKVLSKQDILGKYRTSCNQDRPGQHQKYMFTVLVESRCFELILLSFEVSRDLNVINACLTGILELAVVATYYRDYTMIARILRALSRKYLDYHLTVRCQLIIPVILQLASMAAHLFRVDAWFTYLEVLDKLKCLGLIPNQLLELDDFPDVVLQKVTVQRIIPPPIAVNAVLLKHNNTNGDKPVSQVSLWSITSTLLLKDDDDQVAAEKSENLERAEDYRLALYYDHVGSPRTNDGKIIDVAAGVTLEKTTLTPASPLQDLCDVLLSAPCPFFALRAAIVEVFRIDEFLLDRFRHLPLPSLFGLVTALIVRALPPTILDAATQRNSELNSTHEGHTQDAGKTLEQQESISPGDSRRSSKISQSSKSLAELIAEYKVSAGMGTRMTGKVAPGPPSTPHAVTPDYAQIEAFRAMYDAPFALELLTNLCCARLHAEAVAGESSLFTGTWRGSTGGSASRRLHTLHLAKDQNVTLNAASTVPMAGAGPFVIENALSPNHKATFQHTLWPLVLTYFETALSWYISPGPLTVQTAPPALSGATKEILQNFSPNGIEEYVEMLTSLQTFRLNGQTFSTDIFFAERLLVSVLRVCVRLSREPEELPVLARLLRLVAHLDADLLLRQQSRVVSALRQLMDAAVPLLTDLIANNNFEDGSPASCPAVDDFRGPMEMLRYLLYITQRIAPLQVPPFMPRTSQPRASFETAVEGLKCLCNVVSDRRIQQLLSCAAMSQSTREALELQSLAAPDTGGLNQQKASFFPLYADIYKFILQQILCFSLIRANNGDAETGLTPIAETSFAILDQILKNPLERLEDMGLPETASSVAGESHVVTNFLEILVSQIFPALHCTAIIASFSGDVGTRYKALSVLRDLLMRISTMLFKNSVLYRKETSTPSHLAEAAHLWGTAVWGLVLTPLITLEYVYPYPDLTMDKINKESTTHMKIEADCKSLVQVQLGRKLWTADGLALLLTPEGALAALGAEQLYRRQAEECGLVTRTFLQVAEFLAVAGDTPGQISGDLLCTYVVQLLRLLAKKTQSPDVQLRESAIECLKNVVLVLSASIPNALEIERQQSRLDLRRFWGPGELWRAPTLGKKMNLHKNCATTASASIRQLCAESPEQASDVEAAASNSNVSEIQTPKADWEYFANVLRASTLPHLFIHLAWLALDEVGETSIFLEDLLPLFIPPPPREPPREPVREPVASEPASELAEDPQRKPPSEMFGPPIEASAGVDAGSTMSLTHRGIPTQVQHLQDHGIMTTHETQGPEAALQQLVTPVYELANGAEQDNAPEGVANPRQVGGPEQVDHHGEFENTVRVVDFRHVEDAESHQSNGQCATGTIQTNEVLSHSVALPPHSSPRSSGVVQEVEQSARRSFRDVIPSQPAPTIDSSVVDSSLYGTSGSSSRSSPVSSPPPPPPGVTVIPPLPHRVWSPHSQPVVEGIAMNSALGSEMISESGVETFSGVEPKSDENQIISAGESSGYTPQLQVAVPPSSTNILADNSGNGAGDNADRNDAQEASESQNEPDPVFSPVHIPPISCLGSDSSQKKEQLRSFPGIGAPSNVPSNWSFQSPGRISSPANSALLEEYYNTLLLEPS